MQQFGISEEGLAMTKSFEGLRLEAYQDVAGVWTIGYGHTGPDVREGMIISGVVAEQLLREDMLAAVQCVQHAVTAQIAQEQFDALADFCFNMGARRLLSSTLLRYVNAGNSNAAAGQFGMWVHAGGKVQAGLVKRREAEAKLFLRGCASVSESPTRPTSAEQTARSSAAQSCPARDR